MHILIAHDLTPEADLALQRAAQLARQLEGRLTLLHVQERETDPQPLRERLQALGLPGAELRIAKGQPSATIASQAVLRSYGVVGMAAKNVVDGLTNMLTRDPRHGVEVHVNDGAISIDVYVIVEYGTRVSSVASSVSNAVRFQVEKALGSPVGDINIHVQGLRVSNTDA